MTTVTTYYDPGVITTYYGPSVTTTYYDPGVMATYYDPKDDSVGQQRSDSFFKLKKKKFVSLLV